MTKDIIRGLLLEYFPYEPTQGQMELLEKLSVFVKTDEPRSLFVLSGYAGTGKTTIISALVNILPALKLNSVLLAPTGRAAKILSNYSKKQTLTIHKKIYRKKVVGEWKGTFELTANLHTHTIFIIDEASMISNSGGLSGAGVFGNVSLLEDLLNYVYQGIGCRLIFIGDSAQLPPIGLSISPALDKEYLQRNYDLQISYIELKDIVRQKKESGILNNATSLRGLLKNKGTLKPAFSLNEFTDIVRMSGGELEEALTESYSNYGAEGTLVICRSNKRANIYNQQIRARIKWQEDEISAGDLMMVVKNNYFWLEDNSKVGFIANGDIIEIMKVKGIKELYGFRFADVTIRLADYPEEPLLETKILLDTIMSESPALTQPENKKLHESVLEDYMYIPDKRKRLNELKKDPYFNALQVKFAYAVTCHKAQGGQWPSVFVDQGYITDEMLNTEFIRWLYTAVSRATDKLYLVNFNAGFFQNE